MPSRLMRIVFTGVGFSFFGLGTVGIFVPGLPTAPFMILASVFFMKGSRKANDWFIQTAVYEKYVKEYIETKSLYLKTKIKILLLAGAMMTVSFLLAPYLIIKVLLISAYLTMLYYFFRRIKTREREIR